MDDAVRRKLLLQEIENLLKKFDTSSLDEQVRRPQDTCADCLHAYVCSMRATNIDEEPCEHFKARELLKEDSDDA